MKTLPAFLFFLATVSGASARADWIYFGGAGDLNTHWVGYQVTVAGNSTKWAAYKLDPAKPGKLKIAPATFSPDGTDQWTAVFDEFVIREGSTIAGLAKH